MHFALLGGVWTQRGVQGSPGAQDEAFSQHYESTVSGKTTPAIWIGL